MKASDVKPAKNIFGLFIGKSGSGKDCAAFSFPTPMKVFDIDLRSDGGALGTRAWLPMSHLEQIDIIKVLPTKGWADIDKELLTLQLQYAKGQVPYKTIYFGSFTSLSDLLLTEAGRLMKGLIIKDKGRDQTAASVRMSGPGDYKYLYAAIKDFMDYIRSYPVNIICSAHTMPRWAKPTKSVEQDGQIVEVEDTFGESEEVGERLTLTNALSENIQIYFNEVYRFEKRMSGEKPKHYVRFRTDIAKTVYSQLPNGEIEITGKNFYEIWKSYTEKEIALPAVKK